MDYGLFAMPLHPPERSKVDAYRRDVEMFVLADELGYAEGWMGEHFTLTWENAPATDIFAATVFPQTKRIKIGTGVVVLPFHDPRDVAMRIAYLDQLAPGRLLFGIGPGGFPTDFAYMAVDAASDERRRRFNEAIEIILGIWRERGPWEYQGEFWSVKLPESQAGSPFGHHMRPHQRPHPPIAVAGATPRSESLQMAGERGWRPISLNFSAVRHLKKNWAAVEEGAARSGRVADRRQWAIARDIFVAETDAQAEEAALNGAMARAFREYTRPLIAGVGGLELFRHAEGVTDAEVTPEYLLEHLWIVGSPATVVEKIRALYDEVGGFGTVIQTAYDYDDPEVWNENMRLFATEVMPQSRDLLPRAP